MRTRTLVHSSGKQALLPLLLLSCVACKGQTSWQVATTAMPSSPTVPSSCTFNIALSQTRFNQFGGDLIIFVAASLPTCPWELMTPPWVHVDSRAAGTGAAEVHLTVPPYALNREC